MRKFPIGIQHFEKLRTEGYAYVDKTALVHKLLTEGVIYFLSRPRRFGKSLLLSTIAAIFEGKRDLFSGLAIDALEWDWTPCPVVRVDMNFGEFRTGGAAALREHLTAQVRTNAEQHGLSIAVGYPGQMLADLLAALHRSTSRTVVVLVDEYDKPLLETMHDEALHGDMKSVLKSFYGVLKSADEHLKFGLLTGVTKFGQVSVFSDLNQIKDITYDLRYASLCGITQAELEREFMPEIEAMAATEETPVDAMLGKIRTWYNGYRFHYKAEGVYNPFSTLSLFDRREFGNWWYETGTPTFLVEMVDTFGRPPWELEAWQIPSTSLSSFRADGRDPVPILLQAGYLTFARYDRLTDMFELSYPNLEVRRAFLDNLSQRFSEGGVSSGAFSAPMFIQAVNRGDTAGFMQLLTSLFASLPYRLHEPTEAYWQALFYLVFRLMGQYITTEVHSSKGRADAVVHTSGTIFVFEFKFGGTAAEAVAQIREKGYAEQFRADGRTVKLVGAGFSAAEKNIGGWVEQAL